LFNKSVLKLATYHYFYLFINEEVIPEEMKKSSWRRKKNFN